MALFRRVEKDPRYHAAKDDSEWAILAASSEDLHRWASDPNCIEKEQCAAVLAQRLEKEKLFRLEKQKRNAEKRALLQEDPFDPRTEVSADARYTAGQIVKHLWIILVVLPFILGILYEILK
jgi:hypothetical protein